MNRRQLAATLGLFGLIIVSGVGVVYAKHASRRLFVEQQELRATRDDIDIEWGRLQLELATWGTDSQVEKLARERLKMREPLPDEVVVLVH
jgi:cell division protein FtsL